MIKLALILSSVILAAHSAYSQVGSGTVIIVNFSKDKLVVSADSRAIYPDRNRPPDDSQCKLATFDHKTLFATGGNAAYLRDTVNDIPIGEWRNADEDAR